MTAIVGILNKHGIAVAADSAETIGNGIKIYNKANKIFNLSKYHPVGAAVYGSANFSDLTPWDIIFKLYRENIGKQCLNKTEDYVNSLISFIEEKQFFSEAKELENSLCNNILSYFNEYIIINRICHGNPNGIDLTKLPTVLKEIQKEISTSPVIDSIKDVTKEEFVSSIGIALKQIKQTLAQNGFDYKTIENELKEVLYLSFTRKENMHNHSGVAIFGYGEDEIYPRLFRLKIYGAICGKLKWYIEEKCIIDNNNTGIVCPMAQQDVMMTVLCGIEPKLQQLIVQLTSQVITENIKQIASIAGKTDKSLAKSISAISVQPTLDLFNNNLKAIIDSNHVFPLINTIAILQKEDLAEVAENLIYLTSLIRRITPDKESVGGPIDVALVSKGDGFIWIKRKHYFEETLNKNYFGKYYIDSDDRKEANNE
jgi:hypothetical protein